MSLALAAHPMSVQDKVVYSWGLRGFVCSVFFWTKSRHCPRTPLKRQSNRLLETVFWMIEDYLPSASSEYGFESGGLFAVGWSGNKKYNFCFAIRCQSSSEPPWLTPTITPHRMPTPHLLASPLKKTQTCRTILWSRFPKSLTLELEKKCSAHFQSSGKCGV